MTESEYPETITVEIPDTAMTATVRRERLHPAFERGGWHYQAGPVVLYRRRKGMWIAETEYDDDEADTPQDAFEKVFIFLGRKDMVAPFTLSLPRLIEILRGEGWDVHVHSKDVNIVRCRRSPWALWGLNAFSGKPCVNPNGSGEECHDTEALARCREYLNSLEGAERETWRIPGFDGVNGICGGAYVPPPPTIYVKKASDGDAVLGVVATEPLKNGDAVSVASKEEADLAAARAKYEPLDTREKCIQAMRDGWRIRANLWGEPTPDSWLFALGDILLCGPSVGRGDSIPLSEWRPASSMRFYIKCRHFTPEDDTSLDPSLESAIGAVCNVKNAKVEPLTRKAGDADEVVPVEEIPGPLWIDYTNHKGVRGWRQITSPGAIEFTDTEWHGKAWTFNATDVEKNAVRSFKITDVHEYSDEKFSSPEEFIDYMREHLTLPDDAPPEPDQSPEAIAERIAKGSGAKVVTGENRHPYVNHAGKHFVSSDVYRDIYIGNGYIANYDVGGAGQARCTEAEAIEFLKGCPSLKAGGVPEFGISMLGTPLRKVDTSGPMTGEVRARDTLFAPKPFFTEENWKSLFLAEVAANKTLKWDSRVSSARAALLGMKARAKELEESYRNRESE